MEVRTAGEMMAVEVELLDKMIYKKKGQTEPFNLIMGAVAMLGAILILVNQGNYGLIALIIATLMEAIKRIT